jgi:shikimate kinase
MNNIYLIGMMGSGKTIVAKALAHELLKHVEDLDELIVRREKRSINAIFSESGESYFRTIEKEVLKDIARQSDIVVSTGGGIVLDPENIECMRSSGVMIYLKAPTDILMERLKHESDRPLLRNPDPREALETIYVKRKALYEKAHFSVSTEAKKPFEIAGEIMGLLAVEGRL